VKEGCFVGHAPYGYRNVRIDGRGLVEIDPVNAPKIKRIEDAEVRDWVLRVLRARTREEQDYTREQRAELHRQLTLIQGQTDQLLNLRLLEEINPNTFAAKSTELRDRAAKLKLQADALDRGHDEDADIAIEAFQLPQSLTSKWLTADYAAKRRILKIVCLN